MKKRLISLMTILAMLAAFVVPVSAGYTTDMQYNISCWQVYKSGDNDGAVELVDDIKHSGDHSIQFKYTKPEKLTDGVYMRFINTLSEGVVAGEEYTLEFWADEEYVNFDKDFDDARLQLMVDWGNRISFRNAENTRIVENGMTKFTLKHTPDESGGKGLTILFNWSCGQFRFDDIKYIDSTGKNLVQNGGFEDAADTTIVTNLMAYPINSGGGLNISWTNPMSEYIEACRVYVDDVECDNSSVDLTAEAFNEVLVTGLENYSEYDIKLIVTINGTDYEYTTAGIPDNRGASYSAGDWTVKRQNVLINSEPVHSNFKVEIDENEKYSGNSSLRMDLNLPDRIDNLYPNVTQDVNLKRQNVYQLKFKLKTEKVGRFFTVADHKQKDSAGNTIHRKFSAKYFVSNSVPDSSGWTEYSLILGDDIFCNQTHDDAACDFEFYNLEDTEGEYTVSVSMACDSAIGSMWIDDVEIYELDSETSAPTGENLIKNGGFEDKSGFVTKVFEAVTKMDITDMNTGLVGADYAKFEADVIFEGGENEETLIEFEGVGGNGTIFSVSNNYLQLGDSQTALTCTAGTYNVEAEFDYERGLARITVTLPDGGIIERSDPRYLGTSESITGIKVKSSGAFESIEDIISNIKVNVSDVNDLPTELSKADIKIYEADTLVEDWDMVPVGADKITINVITPLIDKELLDSAVLINGAEIASTEYEKGIYTIYLNKALNADTEYSICTDSSLTGEAKSFKFRTEPAAHAEITGISKGGTNISEIKELTAGDTVTVSLEYTDLNSENQSYSVSAAGYTSEGRLVNVKLSDVLAGTNTCEFTIDTLTDVNEIKFFVWNSLDEMKPLADDYILPLNTFADSEVYNLVTTFYDDAGTTRGFAWTAATGYTDMVIQYAKADVIWTGNNISEAAAYTNYNGLLYYKADIEGLKPGETYVYRIGDTVDNVWSDFYTFTTEPENTTEFSFIGIADPQSQEWAGGYEYLKYTIDEAMSDEPEAEFMVSLGDLTNDGAREVEWTNYFKAIGEYAASLPHMAVLGNHEARGDEVTAGKNFSLHFNNPKNGTDALRGNLTADDVVNDYSKGVVNNIAESVYSFDYGNAHFAVLNTGSDWSSSDTYIMLGKQKEWLIEDLKTTDKKWKIVMLHQGLYPAKTERWNTRGVLSDVIDEYGVDLVLAGHDHIVTRTYPMFNNEIITKEDSITKGVGTVYTILGSSGPKRYDTVVSTPEYAAVINTTAAGMPSYTIFEVSDEKIEVVTKQINGVVADRFTIIDN